MAERVFITGISSFTGPYIAAELLARGYQVFGLSQGDAEIEGVSMLQGNLLQQDSLEQAIGACRPDFVIHLAAITYVPHGDISEMYVTNVVGTRNLLEALAGTDTPPDKVLLASSANVYGNAVEGMLDEQTPFAPANDYAASKVAMEFMSSIWSDRLPIAIVRPFNYTGVGQEDKFLIPKIVSHFQRREAYIELGNIDVHRDFSDVRFVARVYAALLERARPGEVYNVCSSTDYSLKGIVQTMNELAGYDIEVRVNPAFVRANEVRRLVGDNRKILDLVPELSAIPMADTLSWMYNAGA